MMHLFRSPASLKGERLRDRDTLLLLDNHSSASVSAVEQLLRRWQLIIIAEVELCKWSRRKQQGRWLYR